MTILLDTNILLRCVDRRPAYAELRPFLERRLSQGDVLCVTPQVLIEFWVVATRPLDANGFGWEPAAAGKALKGFLSIFPLLPDEPQLLDRWLTLVTTFGVRGKRAHDIRLVAIMAIHGVSHILTFNTADFANIGGVVALSPPVARESQ